MAVFFKYDQISYSDGTTGSAPKIPLILVGKSRRLRTTGLLDTCSTETMIPEGIARILGLEMKVSNKTDVTAVGGKTEGWQSKMKIVVEEKHRKHEITVPACILNSDDLDEIVIGREGFFEAFDITFMEKKKKVKLKPVS